MTQQHQQQHQHQCTHSGTQQQTTSSEGSAPSSTEHIADSDTSIEGTVDLNCSSLTNKVRLDPLSSITAHPLHWSPATNATQIAALLRHNGQRPFDVVIASDCLFFRDFHADLLQTLRSVLVPGGVGIFLQPPRDGTMERFVRLCDESGYFSVEMREDYNPEASALRAQYLDRAEELGYKEDIHYPRMLILQRLA